MLSFLQLPFRKRNQNETFIFRIRKKLKTLTSGHSLSLKTTLGSNYLLFGIFWRKTFNSHWPRCRLCWHWWHYQLKNSLQICNLILPDAPRSRSSKLSLLFLVEFSFAWVQISAVYSSTSPRLLPLYQLSFILRKKCKFFYLSKAFLRQLVLKPWRLL